MFTRIVSDPAVVGGKPSIKDTRISVEMILEWVASGASRDDIIKSYPQLTVEDVEEAINFAAQSPQPLECGEEDSLVDELLGSNAKFQALVAKSKECPRKPFGQSQSTD